MKFQSIQAAWLPAFFLLSSSLSFAAGQPKLHPVDMQRPVGVPQAIQWGKGAGMSRNHPVSRENTLHLQAAVESLALDGKSSTYNPKWSDAAFRK